MGRRVFRIERAQGYTGILVDDLISKGADEPYRMFTSRAEYRLQLRIDNADERLTPYGRRLGLIDDQAWRDYQEKQARAVALEKLLATRKADLARMELLLPELAAGLGNVAGQTYAQLLKRPEVRLETLLPVLREEFHGERSGTDSAELEFFARAMTAKIRNELKSVETEIKYAGYLDQQRKAIEKLKRAEERAIPAWFDYKGHSGLSREIQEKLTRIRPQTLGQASRIPGVTPAALSLLNVLIEVEGRRRAASV